MTDTPGDASVEGADDEFFSWTDDLAAITPLGAKEWLLPALGYLVSAAGCLTGMLLLVHGRPLTPLGWVLVAGVVVLLLVWAAVIAWIGHRASLLYDLSASQAYVRWRTLGRVYIPILLGAIALAAGWWPIVVITSMVFFLGSSGRGSPSAVRLSEFRRTLWAIEDRATLVYGVVLIVVSLGAAAVVIFAFGAGSKFAPVYLGIAPVSVAVGIAFIVRSRWQTADAKRTPSI